MSEALTIQTLRSAMYDRLYGIFQPRLEIHPGSRKRLGKFAKEVLGSKDTPSGKEFVYMGVEVKDNPDMPEGKLRVDRGWTDADVEIWAASEWAARHEATNWDSLKLPPIDFDLPV